MREWTLGSEELGLLYGGDGTAGFQLSDVEVPRVQLTYYIYSKYFI
ncbi:hypothetical protein J7E78_03505 [Paenibacillus polymyxa]|nr:hypothetical protein [Paenibacillus polymyxa]MBT2282603.1 hypothetical protein [Paenibacillus polymyxa]